MRTIDRPFKAFGALIQRARKSRKLTQRSLASQLGVGQQAVSGWERGFSKPESFEQVQKIAELFPEHTLAEWASASKHAIAEKRSVDIALPVRPLAAELPLGALTFEQFQDFSHAFLSAYYPGSSVHQYGGPGDRQRGIDIDVSLADRQYFTFQCKREQRFGPEKVRKAIAQHMVPCDHAIILLSRTATAAARDEVKRKRKKKWDLWDSKDIADRIRSLPTVDKLRLIDTYFPAHRRDFLGIDEPGVFEDADRYFAPFLNRDRMFSHAWSIVGRDQAMASMRRSLEDDGDGVMVIAGAGGIGKTRLLLEISKEWKLNNPETPIHVLPRLTNPTPKDFEIVGSKRGIVVIEDAHDRTDVEAIMHALLRQTHVPRMIVTCRPYALEVTQAVIVRAGALIDSGSPIHLKGLSIEEAEHVAREILLAKRGPEAAAHDIALVAHDSPFALVVGCHLVATKLIHPRALNNADEFRRSLFEGFRDAITGQIGQLIDRQILRSTLEVVSALQPVSSNTQSFAQACSKLTPAPILEIRRAIQLLLEAGVIVEKARHLRIVPDLLGDYLLEEVLSRDPQFTTSVIAECDSEQLAKFLINTAKIDSRRSVSDKAQEQLALRGWEHLHEIVSSAAALPENLVEGVITAAYYQPEQALALYDHILKYESAPKDMAKLLRHVALNVEYLEFACRRLWDLGRDDDRQQNQHPEHPLRILKELAQIQPNTPVAYSGQIVDFAIDKIRRISNPSELNNLFEVLESALLPEGHTTESNGLSFTIRNFAVRHAAVQELRARINEFMLEVIGSGDVIKAMYAASTLSAALRYPRNTTDEVRAEWDREFGESMDRLTAVIQRQSLDSSILVALESSVCWHAKYGIGVSRDSALRLLDAIPKTLDYRVTLAVTDAWGRTRMGPEAAGNWFGEWEKEQDEIAEAVLRAYPDATDALKFLRERLASVIHANPGKDISPGRFVGFLAGRDQLLAFRVCKAAFDDELFARVFAPALFGAMRADQHEGLDVVRSALESGRIELIRDVSSVLSDRQRGSDTTAVAERNILMSLLTHPNDYVVASATRGVACGADVDLAGTASALLTVDVGRSHYLISEFFATVMNQKELQEVFLLQDQITNVLSKMQYTPDIEEYWFEQYLGRASERSPGVTVDFLIERIRHNVSNGSQEFRPMPYLWDERSPLNFRSSSGLKDALLRIREWVEGASDDWRVGFWAPKLYVAVAGVIDEEIVQDLLEWSMYGSPRRFRIVAQLLRDVPPRFCLDNVDLVVRLFERAEQIDDKSAKALGSALFASAISGVRHGTPGQPFPEDVRRHSNSQQALARLPRGSLVAEFYARLSRDAERDIQQKAEEDQALIEEFE
jgi:transcriptional regulator with XRE-family HTH domain